VEIILGNRDINKLRFFSELAEGEDCAVVPNIMLALVPSSLALVFLTILILIGVSWYGWRQDGWLNDGQKDVWTIDVGCKGLHEWAAG